VATELILYLLGAFLAGVVITTLLFRGQRAPAIKAATADSRNEAARANERLERQKKVTEEIGREKIRLTAVVEQLTTDLRKETASRAAAEAASSRIGELKETIRERDAFLAKLRERVSTHEQHKATLETTVKKERQAAAEKLEILERAHEKLSETFKALSSEALRSNNQHFLQIATTAFEKLHTEAKSDLEAREKAVAGIVAPVRETLAKVDSKIQKIEDARLSAYGTLTEQIKSLGTTQENLRNETVSQE
jgi:DNA recombination protein RmuC